jgi:hypothetical protein
MSDADVNELLATYAARVNHEHDFISNRMTWLMTLNGFLVAGLAISIANSDKIPANSLTVILVAVSSLGAVSNASALFSNYWASRAITEMTHALHVALSSLDLKERRAQTWGLLRLYGRDPDNPPMPRSSFWIPPSKVLHPWHLLPIVFTVAYAAAPFSGLIDEIVSRSGIAGSGIGIPLALVPIALTLTTFGVPIILEQRWRAWVRKRRKEESLWEGPWPPIDYYDKEVRPHLARDHLKEVIDVVKCPRWEATLIAEGTLVPHEKYWQELHERLTGLGT